MTFYRAELRSRLNEICHVRGTPTLRPVALVPINWHCSLVNWLECENHPIPPSIDNSMLVKKEKKKWHVDFEIIEQSCFQYLANIFGCNISLYAKVTLHPLTGCSDIVFQTVFLQFLTPVGTFSKICNADWYIDDLKRPLCMSLQLMSSEYKFAPPKDDRTNLEVKMTIAEYSKVYGSQIKLTSGCSSKLLQTHGRRNGYSFKLRNTPTMPALTFSKISLPKALREVAMSVPERRVRPIGIYNSGNYCYFNSAIQVLVRMSPLVNFFSTNDSNICKLFNSLYESMKKSTNNSIDIRPFRHAIFRKLSSFNDGDQHDCQEFLCSLINMMEEDKSIKNDIHNMFFGELKNKIECPKCNNKVEMNDKFLFLSLPVPQNYEKKSLRQCLLQFFQKEELDDDNLWECPNCNKRVNGIHSSELTSMPLFLVIHLKRFRVSEKVARKIDTKIDFPDTLHFRNSKISKDWRFRLKATINHAGTMRSGHYTASCKETAGWFTFSDSKVKETDEKEVHASSAYILFYEAVF